MNPWISQLKKNTKAEDKEDMKIRNQKMNNMCKRKDNNQVIQVIFNTWILKETLQL